MEKIFEYMDAHKNVYIDNLAAAIEIKSVSAWPECRPEIVKMVKWMGSELEKCGATIEYCDVGMQDLPDGGKHFFYLKLTKFKKYKSWHPKGRQLF